MGNVPSRVEEALAAPRIKKAKGRMVKLVSTAWWLGGHVVWTVMTGVIVLAVPVFFEYERECQMFDQMAQVQNAQMNAAPPTQ
mmetsp:Transcript_76634/g.197375  ORF Transcript_76634/g.197375 Transcript_76634/m.197375 type:complete len:83 (-) Transcript_76634:38-286(-)